jgi:hypothetical protein
LRTAAILFILATVAGCKGYGLNELPYTEDPTQWGQPVNGLQVGVAKRSYTPGNAPTVDQVYLIVRLRNVSRGDLTLLAPAAVGGTMPEKPVGDESVMVKLVYDSAAGVKTGEFRPINKPTVQAMESGKDYNLEVRLSPSKFGMDRFVPGRMSAVYSNNQSTIKYDMMGGQTVKGIWIGEAKSGTVSLEAAAPATQQGGGERK